MRDLALGVAEEAVVVGVDSALTKPMLRYVDVYPDPLPAETL